MSTFDEGAIRALYGRHRVQSTPAAWHGRSDDVAALTAELTEVLRARVAVV